MSFRHQLAAQIATVGSIGRVPFAPGTFGSLAAIPIAWGLHYLGGITALLVATVVLGYAGYWASREYLAGRQEDPSEIVIDEVVGMLITLMPLSIGLTMAGSAPHVFPWPGWVGGFLAFRFFDILKPPPIRWADRPGPLGVMLDDIVAGIMAAASVLLAAGVSHGWFV